MTGLPPVQRVVQIHTRYRQAGGEERVVEAERQLLEGAGVDVKQVIFDNADLRESRSLVGDMQLASSAIWSRAAVRRVRAAVAGHRPQVVHVHNTFPAASPAVYSASVAEGVPVVQTVHNYRFVCPAATAFRDGHPCTDCVGMAVPLPAVVHACVRGSRTQSAVAGATIALHRAIGTFRTKVALYLALTSFQRSLLVAGGFPEDRIRVVPNFLEPDPGEGSGARTRILYVGRLSAEKGVLPLLEAAALAPGLVRVAGEGPLEPPVREASGAGHVEYVGQLASASVHAEMQGALALVLPSIWYEGFPIVVGEAYATGTPIIASRIGSLAELIEDGETGLLVEPSDPVALAGRLRWARDHPEEMRRMGVNARRTYEARYRGDVHLAALLDAYSWAGRGLP